MKYVNPAGQTYNVDKAFLEALDREQNRERYPNSVVAAIVALTGAHSLLLENADKVRLMSNRHNDHAWRMYKQAEGLIQAANTRLCSRMSSRQNLACVENTKDYMISISAKPNERSVNIIQSDVDMLCKGCLEHCKDCIKTESEARQCELRRTLDCMTNIEADETGFLMCPYMSAEVTKWKGT